ncbi:hypothetical protein BBBOND_0314030 [Babesia bigemina]|uniref:C3H1-type domain-containing protein n=1 Tax=Babesia bigemina TaxID=5866 RepID=A0A061D9W3_BABBI|nr:hypothetical protein BBBOND_0314030 [Babesia bigemina]CDR97501.1 hypothetical protein BBBOND_0314030 [Babesia bigemina]|eukprot:XP_012769687.1 hypothetical protein BBBOND_0314030 [Babesia bigemina]
MKELIKNIKQRVSAIMKQLTKINSDLLQHIDTLQDWITKADNVIKESLKKVEEILKEVKDSNSRTENNRRKIESAVEYIQSQVKLLFEAGELARKEAASLVGTAKEKVTLLENAVKGDLATLKNEINNGMKEYVSRYITEIHNSVKEIKGGDASGLTELVGRVKGYVKLFTKGKLAFNSVLQRWIGEIVDKEPVSGWLDKYVEEMNESSIQFKDVYIAIQQGSDHRLLAAFKNKLIEELHAKVNEAFNSFYAVDEKGSIGSHVGAAKGACLQFAKKLGDELEDGMIGTFVEDIADAISLELTTQKNSNPYLQLAVDGVLYQLLAAARHTAAAVESFTWDDSASDPDVMTVDSALGVAIHLDTGLSKALASVTPGSDGDLAKAYIYKPFHSLKQPIELDVNIQKTIYDMLEKQLPEDQEAADNLQAYVTLDNLADSFKGIATRFGTKPSKRKQLEDAINNIEAEVTIALAGIETFNDQALRHFIEVSNKLNEMCYAIENAAGEPNGLKSTLKTFKETYFAKYDKDTQEGKAGIDKIKQDLSDVQNALKTGPVDKTNDLLQYAMKAENHFAKLIKDQIHQDIKTAETALTTHARRRYVDSIKWLLGQFVLKVETEFSQLLLQIEHDKHIGLKGFMEAFNGNDSGDNVNRLLSNSDIPTLCRSVETFFAPVKSYIDSEITRLDGEELKKHPSLPRSQDPYTSKLTKLYAALSGLISHVYTSNKYDRDLPTKLDDLTAAVADLTTDGFPNPVTAMLHGVSGGCRELVGALGKVYISRYDGANVRWEHDEKAVNNCAKAFLTIVPAYFHGLHHLFYKGATEWKEYKVAGNAKSDRKADELKKYLQEEGYDIDQLKDQTGKEVALRLSRGFARYQSFNENPENLGTYKEYLAHYKKHEGLMSRLFYYLDAYNHVGHLVVHPRPRHPSSVFDILLWLNGLPYNPVYHALSYDGFSGLFEREEKKGDATADDDGPTFEGEEADTLPAHPKDITAASLADKLTEVTTYAEDVLLSILGYGHNDGIYACDFYTNAGKLAYPSSAAKCLDVLVELLYRLFHQLRFLYEQCSNSTQYSGWAECWYGQGVGGSSWKCNEKQCADQNCRQIADQIANQKCKQHPKCGVKSPLQSFLEDGLPGFLPHPYNKADCKLSCSAPNHFGKPCKTPMGFADISITASHTSKGSRLYKVLKEFCGTPSSPLTVVCSSLVCVLGRPPQTLGDMFAFYHLFITTWNDGGKKHKKEAFDEAVTKANLQRPYDELNVASIFSTTHSGKSKTHTSGDLISLVCSSKTAATCGQYLSPLSNDISATFSLKHADKYVSWMVYLTETFYSLLKKMYDECNSKCGGATPKCRVAKCPKKCTANEKSPGSTHHSLCDSIINCPSTSSVLCTYGFTLVDRKKLSGTNDVDYKRTCNDLCNALKKVLDGESVLMQLFHSIDKFIFTIRAPFIWLNVALWSLSFLYLIHIMVIRLDLLHIKSHLHSPSSHRIAAQSLLAAARVNKLNRVFYLQP